VSPDSPARPGETLVLYLVGMGGTDQPVSSGAAAPGDPFANVKEQPTVTIGGQNAAVSFAGLTPGAVGLYQINVTVPDNLPPGTAEVAVTQLETLSNTFTVPVQ
jgi:uncharacterized protein (TIGR03437 family)